MIRSFDETTRRILTFPAVHPCDGTSLPTLLESLTSLARSIQSFRSEPFSFASNRRNAKNAIRLVETLLIFLEDLQHFTRPHKPSPSDSYPDPDLCSALLSLSELHVTFQKIQFLLADCTRKDARLWMLSKSTEVANHFTALTADLATALEIFPIESSDLSDESKESVRFVGSQSRTAKYRPDPDDDVAWRIVRAALDRFERRVIPDPSELKWVVEYLGVRGWGECNREIKFLEDEICSQKVLNEDTSEVVTLLDGLLGFMTYCRCVVFFGSSCGGDAVSRKSTVERSSNNVNSYNGLFGAVGSRVISLNEEDLRCPISLEIMSDPVTISTGQTFDRVSILKWFRTGNQTCPKTGERLQSLGWVPNIAIQRLIKQYAEHNDIALPKSGGGRGDRSTAVVVVNATSQASKEAMKMVSEYLTLKLAIGPMVEKSKAAYEVRLLTKRSGFNRACFVESGLIPYLLNLLLSRDSSLALENSTAALLNLSKCSKARPAIVQNGGLQLLLKVLKDGTRNEARENAAAVVFYLASVDEYCNLIGNMQGMIPALVDLIEVGGDRGKKNALVAMFGLLSQQSNHKRVLNAEAVPLLVNLLRSLETEDLMTDVLAVLSALAEEPDGSRAILRVGQLTVVVGAFCSLNSRFGKEHCVSLLQFLCLHGGREVVQVLAKNPSLMGSLYSLLTNGTPRASKKASSIIGMLHEFSESSERSSSTSAPRPLPHDRFIHVW